MKTSNSKISISWLAKVLYGSALSLAILLPAPLVMAKDVVCRAGDEPLRATYESEVGPLPPGGVAVL